MRAADTNLVVRLLTRDDAEQVVAAEGFIQQSAWVSHLVLLEAVWVLTYVYRRSQPETVTAIEMLLQHNRLVLQDSDTVLAALAHFRTTHAPEFADCLILEIARKNGNLPLGTFDSRLSRLSGAVRVQ